MSDSFRQAYKERDARLCRACEEWLKRTKENDHKFDYALWKLRKIQ